MMITTTSNSHCQTFLTHSNNSNLREVSGIKKYQGEWGLMLRDSHVFSHVKVMAHTMGVKRASLLTPGTCTYYLCLSMLTARAQKADGRVLWEFSTPCYAQE